MTKEEMDELMARLWKLDDKPHLLYSHLRTLVDKYYSKENSVYRRGLYKMADFGYENAYKLLKSDLP